MKCSRYGLVVGAVLFSTAAFSAGLVGGTTATLNSTIHAGTSAQIGLANTTIAATNEAVSAASAGLPAGGMTGSSSTSESTPINGVKNSVNGTFADSPGSVREPGSLVLMDSSLVQQQARIHEQSMKNLEAAHARMIAHDKVSSASSSASGQVLAEEPDQALNAA